MPLETITLLKKYAPDFEWAVSAIEEITITKRYYFSGSTQFEISYTNARKVFALGIFYERRKNQLAEMEEGKEVSNG